MNQGYDEELVDPVARCLAQLDERFIGATWWKDRLQAEYQKRARRVLQTIANVQEHREPLPSTPWRSE